MRQVFNKNKGGTEIGPQFVISFVVFKAMGISSGAKIVGKDLALIKSIPKMVTMARKIPSNKKVAPIIPETKSAEFLAGPNNK